MEADLSKCKAAVYCRKSSDSEDRQVQSIPDQQRELAPVLKYMQLKKVVEFGESQSAKRPGRPQFNEMIAMIESGKVDVLVCWKINRLARNPIDGGKIQWLLQQGALKAIVTPSKIYLPTDNVLMMTVELGMATQYSLDLSRDVLRGMTSKVNKGSPPWKAPVGYLNDPRGLKGQKQIFVDKEKFPLVRKMWDLMLTGNYTIKAITDKAGQEWGLSNREGKPLSLGGGYKTFTNPFYYGEFTFKGEINIGNYEPMITKEEFDMVQKILGRAGKPRPKYKRLPFNGVINCGGCGAMVTADEKHKCIKSTGTMAQWIYHRCTRRKKDTDCHERPIKHEELLKQIEECLDSITIPPEFLHWAIEVLRENNAVEESTRAQMITNQRKTYDGCLQRIQNLINLYVSPDNAGRELLSEEEFKAQKNLLVEQKNKAEAELRKIETNVDGWLDLTEKTFNFATYAKAWFDKGDYEQKTQILRALGKNLTLKDGKLHIDLQKPFLILKDGLQVEPLKTARLEPTVIALDKTQNTPLGGANLRWSG